MTLTHKIKKALRPQTYAKSGLAKLITAPRSTVRAWREQRAKERAARRKKDLTVENLLRNVDRAALEQIRERYSDAGERPDVFWTKYLDYNKWLTQNIRYANELGLVANPPRSVLDLGCGGGYFLTVCRQLGARVVGMDLNKDLVLNEMIAAFKLNRITWRIRPFVKLPGVRGKFDLITAWMICFNFPPNRPIWGPAEWDFFLNDLVSRLTSRGKVILSLNPEPDGKHYDETLRSFFESRGALIEGKRLTFTREGLARTVHVRREATTATTAAVRR
jgi:SAM-dependent methyltransferase